MRNRASLCILLSFLFCLTQIHSVQFIIQHDPQRKTASCLIYMSKRSITSPRHCHHNEILSTCQEAAKVPNKCVAKLPICGFLGVALAANGLSVRALVKKNWGLFTAGPFWKLVALWHPQPSMGLRYWIASYYPELRRIVFGSRMPTFSYDTNLQVGAFYSHCARQASFVRSSSSYHGYSPSLLIGDLFNLKITAWVILSRFQLNCTCKTTLCFTATYRKPTRDISAVFTYTVVKRGLEINAQDFAGSSVLGCDRSCKNNEAVHSLSVSPYVVFSFVCLVITARQYECC